MSKKILLIIILSVYLILNSYIFFDYNKNINEINNILNKIEKSNYNNIINEINDNINILEEKLQQDSLLNFFNLSQKCSEEAQKYFNSNWKYLSNIKNIDYNNHYNNLLNKCFILVDIDIYETISDVKKITNYRILEDIQENLRYGFLMINNPDFECEVSGEECYSIGDFELKVKPYMSN